MSKRELHWPRGLQSNSLALSRGRWLSSYRRFRSVSRLQKRAKVLGGWWARCAGESGGEHAALQNAGAYTEAAVFAPASWSAPALWRFPMVRQFATVAKQLNCDAKGSQLIEETPPFPNSATFMLRGRLRQHFGSRGVTARISLSRPISSQRPSRTQDDTAAHPGTACRANFLGRSATMSMLEHFDYCLKAL